MRTWGVRGVGRKGDWGVAVTNSRSSGDGGGCVVIVAQAVCARVDLAVDEMAWGM